MKRENRYQRKARVAREDTASPRSLALIEKEYAKTNNRLLQMRAWCPKHFIRYPINAWVPERRRIEGQGCPECAQDKAWLKQAVTQLGEAAKSTPPADVLALAEELAGHKLYGYR